jgi:hypothetical protein
VSAIKFALVVAWFMRLGLDQSWGKKALLAALVVGGGAVIALRLLLV